MQNLTKIIAAFMLFFSLGANAATTSSAAGLTVTSVQVLDHGGFVVWFDSEVSSVCTANGTKSVFYYSGQHQVTPDGIKSLLSATLTALSTGMKVDIIYDGSSEYCWGRYFRLKK